MSLGLIREGMRAAGFEWDHELLYHQRRPPTEDERAAVVANGHQLTAFGAGRMSHRSDLSVPRFVVDDCEGWGDSDGRLAFVPDGVTVISEQDESWADHVSPYRRWAGHLYFMRNTDGLVKIGRSVHPRKRRARIEVVEGQRVSLDLVVRDAGDIEQSLHRIFVKARVRGEWFHPIDDILGVVDATRANGSTIDALMVALGKVKGSRR